jgi:hypothetical protein
LPWRGFWALSPAPSSIIAGPSRHFKTSLLLSYRKNNRLFPQGKILPDIKKGPEKKPDAFVS